MRAHVTRQVRASFLTLLAAAFAQATVPLALAAAPAQELPASDLPERALAAPDLLVPDPSAGHAAEAQQVLVMVRMPPAHFRPDLSYGEGYRALSAHEARQRIAAEIARSYNLLLESSEASWPMPALGVECFVLRVPQAQSAAAVVAAIAKDPRAAWAQAVQSFHGLGYNDPLLPLQPTAREWHLQELHAVATGRSVRIAELDSGVDRGHLDLSGQIADFQDFTGRPERAESHGTAVAGILVARADNGVGIAGVAPHARLLALRACWQATAEVTDCNSLTLAKALQSAIERRAQIVNLSVSGPADRLLQELIDVALARGIVVVAAADPAVALGGFPASHRGVVSVAMPADETSPARPLARPPATPFAPPIAPPIAPPLAPPLATPLAPTPPPSLAPARILPVASALVPSAAAAPLAAPGRDVPAPVAGGGWSFFTGASFAAAEVSGLIALLLEQNPDLRPEQIHLLLEGEQRGVRDAGTTAPVSIDACRALSAVTGACVCDCPRALTSNVPARR